MHKLFQEEAGFKRIDNQDRRFIWIGVVRQQCAEEYILCS